MSKEILCRIDPEELKSIGIKNYNYFDLFRAITDYITAHAVPETPLIFGGVEELAGFFSRDVGFNLMYTGSVQALAKALLDRFGVQWEPNASYFEGQQYSETGTRFDSGMIRIDRPLLTIEEQKKALIEKINKMTPEEFKEFTNE